MKIIILGAGQVGGTLAENLVNEHNDITLVDQNIEQLKGLQDRLDLRVVHGNGAHPDVLRNAGAADADLIVAVTSSDEVNMLACQVAFALFKVKTKIARIRSNAYLDYKKPLFVERAICVDHIISPEQLVIDYLVRLIEYPGALQVVHFANERVGLVALKAYYGGKLVGNALASLRDHMPNIETRVAAIFRRGQPIKPIGTTIIEADDEVFFIADANHIRAVIPELQRMEQSCHNIMIGGGGNIGAGLASVLEKRCSVKLIEHSPRRAQQLSEQLKNTTVFCGDVADQELLLEEHIDRIDVFVAVTNEDETNIMSALLAKRLGAKKTMVLIQRSAYIDLVQGGDIDIAFSPQQATISALLTHVRRGDIVNVYSLRRGVAEAIEVIAHGDEKTSKVIGREIDHLKLPPGTTIGAIVRSQEVIIAHRATIIQENDHVILFLGDKKYIQDVEQLFQTQKKPAFL